MRKKGKNKIPKDERAQKTKMRRSDHLKTNPPSKPTLVPTKKYSVSSATNHISTIRINDDDIDDILRLLLEMEMNEKGFDTVESCIANMLNPEGEGGETSRNHVEDCSNNEDSSEDSSEESDSSDGDSSDTDSDTDSDSTGSDSTGSDSTGSSSLNNCAKVVDGISGDDGTDCNKLDSTFRHQDREDESRDDGYDEKISTEDGAESEKTAYEDVVLGESMTPAPAPPPAVPRDFVISSQLKRFMRKKLIRDDRRMANELKAKQSEEKQKQKLIKKDRFDKEQELIRQQQQQHDKARRHAGAASVSSSAGGVLSSQDAKLRLQVCSQKSKSAMKLLMVDRDRGWTVEELVAVVRTKLNESKKFNSLMIIPNKKSFEDEDIRLFDNDTQLCLYVDATKKARLPATGASLAKEKRPVPAPRLSIVPVIPVEILPPPPEAPLSFVEDRKSDDQPHQKQQPGPLQHDDDAQEMDSSIDISSPLCMDVNVSASLRRDKDAMVAQARYADMLQGRAKLPMFKARKAFLSELQASESRTMIVVGDTGCGKTTQVPQIILDDAVDRGEGAATYIICTQPRRIAAISVAERVAQERLQACGQSVGYQIRLKSRYSQRDTRILFCTTGILLRKMQDKEFLSRVSHIIIDEVHERQVETDFLMAILRSEMSFRHNLHLIFMSATLNSENLRAYMLGCPVIQVPGRVFPVAVHYMEDINSIISVQQKIHSMGGDSRVVKEDMLTTSLKKQKKPARPKFPASSGHSDMAPKSIFPNFNADTVAEFIIRLIEKENTAGQRDVGKEQGGRRGHAGSRAVLVFLSGIQAITAVMNTLRHRQTLDHLKAKVFILHSSVPAELQSRVFAKLQDPYEWKIVLSTNIAESSVTVDDVVHVIDTGFHREMTFDPVARVSMLSTVFASKASLAQRCGRAGRVRPGDCWRLFSEQFMDSPRLPEYSLPEIKRVPLEDVVLQILILQLGNPRDFLAKCMDPPSAEQVEEAVQVLLDIGAIITEIQPENSALVTETGRGMTSAAIQHLVHHPYLYRLTPLGRHLANLPVDVRLGKMLIYASIFGCLEPALTIVATLSGKSPMVVPPNNREEANDAHARFCTISSKQKHPFFASGQDGSEGDGKSSVYSPYSDHIAYVRMYDEFIRVHNAHSRSGRRGPEVYNFCKANHLSMRVLDDITALREQFRRYLDNAGFLGATHLPTATADNISGAVDPVNIGNNHFAASDAILRCVICAGLFPRVTRVCKVQSHSSAAKSSRSKQFVQKMFEASGDTVNVHLASLLCKHTKTLLENDTVLYKDGKDKKKEAFVVYYKKISSPLAQLYDCTEVSPLSLMLFGESFSEMVKSKRSKVIVNKWIHLGISEDNAVLIRKLRYEIEQILLAKSEGSGGRSESYQHYLQKKQYLVTCILEKILEQVYN